jgi:hypothetical protein
MDPATVEWWLKTGSIYGLGFVVIAGGIAFAFWVAWLLVRGCRKWVPNVIGAHVGNVNANSEALRSLSTCYETLTDTQRVSEQRHEEDKQRTIVAMERTANTLDRIVDTNNAIQREVTEHRKLQEKIIDKIDQFQIFIKTDRVEVPAEAIVDASPKPLKE